MLSHWIALIVVPTPPYTDLHLQAYPRATSNSHKLYIKYNIPHNCLNYTSIYYLSSVILNDYFLFSMSWSIGMLLFNSITFLFAIIKNVPHYGA